MGELETYVIIPAKHAIRRLLGRPPSTARRYLRKGISVDKFLGRLTAQGARYAVLRWFETLPAVERNTDIDVLVADEDLALAESFLTPYRPLGPVQKIDLYTAGGLPRTDFGKVPYFPEKLAAGVLERAVLLNGRYKVPSPIDHLDSLAFHAVHHKGEASGLPKDASTSLAGDGGRIGSTLNRLARDLSRDLELSLKGLNRYLTAEGLQPPAETLERYAAERRRLYCSGN